MDRFRLPLSVDYLDGIKRSPIFESYDPDGEYMHFRTLGVLGWKIVSLDENRIPINIHHGSLHHNPVTIAHYALELFSKIVSKDESNDQESEADFKRVIEWILKNQNADGGWNFDFNHLFFKDRVEFLKAPWYSALSQGMMISALTRARKIIDFDWEKAIDKSLGVICRNVEDGGVKRFAFGVNAFYEEYPTTPPSYVLNGFMFCLVGLFDGWKATGRADFEKAYREGVATLECVLPMYDLTNGSAYDLTHITSRVEGPNKARHSYHRLHVSLLSLLNFMEGGRFSRVVSRWDAYLSGNQLITN